MFICFSLSRWGFLVYKLAAGKEWKNLEKNEKKKMLHIDLNLKSMKVSLTKF